MPYPVILVNSATGSDSAASGAGPSTALTGSSASTDATGLVVTLSGSPSLTNVATDGSHVLFLDDTTSNVRNFGSIAAKDDVAKTVTITTGEAFRASASGLSWAIGGKRASVNASPSSRLWALGVAAGDAMPGWTVRMESGHTESGGQITFRRHGDVTGGYITLEGDPAAATVPTYTSSSNAISMPPNYIRVQNFALRKSGASGGTGVILSPNSVAFRMQIQNNSGVKFATGIDSTFSTGSVVEQNYIETVTGVGVIAAIEQRFAYNVVLGCGSFGIHLTGPTTRLPEIIGNIIAGGSSDGIRIANTSDFAVIRNLTIFGNTIHGNSGDGIEFSSSSTQRAVFHALVIASNHITGNGGYGLNFSGSSVTDELISRLGGRIACNNFGTGGTANTSGIANFTLTTSGSDNVSLDPGYTNAASNDFSVNANTAAKGFPLTLIGAGAISGNQSYVDIGALQRQASSGGGVPLIGTGGLVY